MGRGGRGTGSLLVRLCSRVQTVLDGTATTLRIENGLQQKKANKEVSFLSLSY